jgi:hypothetical protein
MPSHADDDHRRRLLVAALGFLQLEPRAPELRTLHAWLSTWAGIGHIVTGMERQGYAMSLRRIREDGWAATFDRHPMFAPDGFATAATPWAAVQAAAWRAVRTAASR